MHSALKRCFSVLRSLSQCGTPRQMGAQKRHKGQGAPTDGATETSERADAQQQPEASTSQTSVSSVPDDVFENLLLDKLDWKDLVALARTSRRWRRLAVRRNKGLVGAHRRLLAVPWAPAAPAARPPGN